MKKYLLTGTFIFFTFSLIAQTYPPFRQIKQYTEKQTPNRFDSSLNYLNNRLGFEIHYLYPLYQAIGWEDKFKKLLGEKDFYDLFSQFISFTGDYAMALAYNQKSFDPIPDSTANNIKDWVAGLKNTKYSNGKTSIQYVSAKASIIDNAQHSQVIMLNEAHNKPVHRAFTYSLLDDLYKQGYRYFAMETFNNFSNKCLDSLNVFTGYYTNEPVAGELVRKALQIGYKLIAYEDTAVVQNHTASQRDSVQASNIYSYIKKDPSAKILVHAGYSHVSKEKTEDYTPMAWWFKKMSGIDPFTVEQTGMTEGGESEAGRLLYQYFTEKFSITEPSVFFEKKRPMNPLQKKGYDMIVVYPRTTYQNDRPSWLSLNGERQPVLIQPTERSLFLVQAYYEKEYSEDKIMNVLIPADQTYISTREGYYCLYLKKGKYKIAMRDISYKLLSTKDLEVK